MSYIPEVRKQTFRWPRVLSHEDMVRLFKQIEAGGQKAKIAKETLIRHNQGLVIGIARRFLGRGLTFDQLLNEGNFALLNAINGFDHRRGFKFSTYAVKCIRGMLNNAVSKNRSSISKFTSLDAPLHVGETDGPTLHDQYPDSSLNSEDLTDIHASLPRLLDTLPPPERRILELIYGLAPDYPGREMTLDETGAVVGLSRERIRQIKSAALAQLNETVITPKKPIPNLKWLKDQDALRLMLGTLSPEEHLLFQITFRSWLTIERVAELLEKPSAEIRELRKNLYRKLNDMYDIVQSVGAQNIKSANELRALARLTAIKKRIESDRETVPRDKTDLCRKLGICKFTLRNWQKDSEKVREAIAEIIMFDKKTAWRLHRHEQLPAEKRTALFAHGYNRLAASERDLGRDPIGLAEIASVINYDVGTIMRWIIDSPETIGPNAILYLKSFSLPKTFTLELRRRRLAWALNFARENGFRYLNPAGFAKERLNITRLALRNWMMEDPEVANIFAEYPGVIGGRPKNIAA